MRLLRIEVENFRQFSGKHDMNLGDHVEKNKNVIVIHGENGSGKTTLLNAFKWCFYGQTDFDSQDEKLLNERSVASAAAGSRIEMAVSVEFEHDGLRHTARRFSLFKKSDDNAYDPIGGSTFKLSWIDAVGAFKESPNPDTHMSQILPEKMQSYFFFNGERIEKLAHVNAAEQVQSAIKNLMGLEIVERASQHLGGAVLSKLRKELKETSPKDLADVIEAENVLVEEVAKTKREIAVVEKNISEFKEELNEVNKALENNLEVSGLQRERMTLDDEISDLQEKSVRLLRERRDYLSANACLAFSEALVATSSAILDEKRKKGELPFKVKEQFITDLLAQEKCICDRELQKDSPPYRAVDAFKRSTTSADVENAFIETSSTLSQMVKGRAELFSRLKVFQRDEATLAADIMRKQGRIDVISQQIGERDAEDIAKLEAKRGEISEKRDAYVSKKGGLLSDLATWEQRLAAKKQEREKLTLAHAQGGVATRRLELAEEVKRVIDALYVALAEQVRSKLSSKVDTTFKAIMRKPYWAEISKDYTLQIYKEVGGQKQIVYEKSTGESQITSLSFVGSIVSIARERSAEASENFKGGVFPIVMDSPFGALDDDYRDKIADYIPALAEQVIVMVSGSQWRGAVERKVTPRMAKEYTLYSLTRDDQKLRNEAHEYTEIREGNHVQ